MCNVIAFSFAKKRFLPALRTAACGVANIKKTGPCSFRASLQGRQDVERALHEVEEGGRQEKNHRKLSSVEFQNGTTFEMTLIRRIRAEFA